MRTINEVIPPVAVELPVGGDWDMTGIIANLLPDQSMDYFGATTIVNDGQQVFTVNEIVPVHPLIGVQTSYFGASSITTLNGAFKVQIPAVTPYPLALIYFVIYEGAILPADDVIDKIAGVGGDFTLVYIVPDESNGYYVVFTTSTNGVQDDFPLITTLGQLGDTVHIEFDAINNSIKVGINNGAVETTSLASAVGFDLANFTDVNIQAFIALANDVEGPLNYSLTLDYGNTDGGRTALQGISDAIVTSKQDGTIYRVSQPGKVKGIKSKINDHVMLINNKQDIILLPKLVVDDILTTKNFDPTASLRSSRNIVDRSIDSTVSGTINADQSWFNTVNKIFDTGLTDINSWRLTNVHLAAEPAIKDNDFIGICFTNVNKSGLPTLNAQVSHGFASTSNVLLPSGEELVYASNGDGYHERYIATRNKVYYFQYKLSVDKFILLNPDEIEFDYYGRLSTPVMKGEDSNDINFMFRSIIGTPYVPNTDPFGNGAQDSVKVLALSHRYVAILYRDNSNDIYVLVLDISSGSYQRATGQSAINLPEVTGIDYADFGLIKTEVVKYEYSQHLAKHTQFTMAVVLDNGTMYTVQFISDVGCFMVKQDVTLPVPSGTYLYPYNVEPIGEGRFAVLENNNIRVYSYQTLNVPGDTPLATSVSFISTTAGSTFDGVDGSFEVIKHGRIKANESGLILLTCLASGVTTPRVALIPLYFNQQNNTVERYPGLRLNYVNGTSAYYLEPIVYSAIPVADSKKYVSPMYFGGNKWGVILNYKYAGSHIVNNESTMFFIELVYDSRNADLNNHFRFRHFSSEIRFKKSKMAKPAMLSENLWAMYENTSGVGDPKVELWKWEITKGNPFKNTF